MRMPSAGIKLTYNFWSVRSHKRPQVDVWMNPTHTEPAAALMSGEFLVMAGEGQAYSEQEADTWLGQTGWRKIEKTPLAGPTSLIVAEAV
jgi:hypothetical protein